MKRLIIVAALTTISFSLSAKTSVCINSNDNKNISILDFGANQEIIERNLPVELKVDYAFGFLLKTSTDQNELDHRVVVVSPTKVESGLFWVKGLKILIDGDKTEAAGRRVTAGFKWHKDGFEKLGLISIKKGRCN